MARLRRRRPDQPPQRRDLHATSPSASPRASPRGSRCASCAPPSRSRATARSSGSWSAATSCGRRDGRIRAVDTGERETHRVRPGAALDRLQGHPDRGRPLRRAPRPDPERGRPGRRRRRARSRALRGRLDQARPLRRDRDQQEGRPGDRRQPVRRPRGGQVPEAELAGDRGSIESLSTSASPTMSPSRAGRRSTPPRSRPGKPHGRPRVKLCRVDELVEASKAKTAA